MKLAYKSAGLCGCGVGIVTIYAGIFKNVSPVDMQSYMQSLSNDGFMEVLYLAAPGFIVGGIIGYMMGNILSKPQGNNNKSKKKNTPQPEKPSNKREMTTGNESFLDDLSETHPIDTPEGDNMPSLEPFEGFEGSMPEAVVNPAADVPS